MIIFRKNALKTLSSAEELDQSIYVTNSILWLTLWALMVCLIVFLAWSVLASISYRTSSGGVFLPENGYIVNVTPYQNGVLHTINVKVGDHVRKNDIVATLSNKKIDGLLKSENHKLNLEQNNLNKITNQIAQERKERRKNNKQHINYLDDGIKALNIEVADSLSIFTNNKELYNQNNLTQSTLIASRSSLSQLRDRLNNLILEKNEVIFRENELTHQENIRVDGLQKTISSLKDRVESIKIDLESNLVRSNVYGRVIELKQIELEQANINKPILTILTQKIPDSEIEAVDKHYKFLANVQQEVEFIAYVSVIDGKKLNVDTPVQIEVEALDKNSYGFIEGSVKFVSEFPFSSSGLYTRLANKDLVSFFTKQGPVHEVVVSLIKDKKSFNGFKWTSKKGAQVNKIRPGSLGRANFILESKRPIELAIPAIGLLFD